MNLQAKKDFYQLAEQFKNNEFNLQTVSNLVVLVRLHRKELSEKEARILLEIPLNVLSNDVELIESKKWANKNATYFSGNIAGGASGAFAATWKAKFESGEYELNDIYELSRIVSENFEEYRNSCEFLLRNIEVTLRDDVKVLEWSKFYKSGPVFYSHMLNAINF